MTDWKTQRRKQLDAMAREGVRFSERDAREDLALGTHGTDGVLALRWGWMQGDLPNLMAVWKVRIGWRTVLVLYPWIEDPGKRWKLEKMQRAEVRVALGERREAA